jgi:hypothetical protein
MKQLLLAVVPVVAMFATGCSSGSSASPFGADPDFQSIKARMDHPDGTFNSSNASSVFAQFSTSQSGSSAASVSGAPGAASSTTGTASYRLHSTGLRLMDASFASCPAMQHGDLTGTCSCPGGGNLTYDFSEYQNASKSGQVADVTARVAMSQCVEQNGDMVDGKEFLHAHQDTTGAVADNSILMVADMTARLSGVTHTLDLNMLLEQNAMGESVQIAVQVDDGWVVVAASASADGKTGSYTIRDKNGSWSCSVTNGAGMCTGTGGQSATFKP